MKLRTTLAIVGLLALGACTSGCAQLAGGGTGLDPKFIAAVKDVVTDPKCGHHDEFRATVGAAGVPASTTVVAVRDCPTPAVTAPAAVPAPTQ